MDCIKKSILPNAVESEFAVNALEVVKIKFGKAFFSFWNVGLWDFFNDRF